MDTKVLALYLPQFHRVKENDEWWGEGFTDWISCKKAEPLFEGHYQPHVPLDEYDLSDVEVMRRQAKMMEDYGIDGACIYHYYFENGKKLLEKPAENLLKETSIDMPYCFYWANESWIRTWEKVESGNAWSDIEDESNRGGEGILVRQAYGREEEWKRHFEYLLLFFRDDRYIKHNGRPLMFIYRIQDIDCFSEMKECWDQCAKEAGIEPVFFVCTEMDNGKTDAYLMHEVAYSGTCSPGIKNRIPGFKYALSYEEMIENILTYQKVDKLHWSSVCVGYDATPRKGKAGGVIYGSTPDKFKELLTRALIKSNVSSSPFLLINAWNEWGEGMHLEPDEKFGYGYLEAVKKSRDYVENHMDFLSKVIADNKYAVDRLNDERHMVSHYKFQKIQNLWNMACDWLALKIDGNSVESKIISMGYSEIAVYGMGALGEMLLKDLKGSRVSVEFGIDIDSNNKDFELSVIRPDEDIPNIPLIVVTVASDYEIVRKRLLEKTNARIVSLGELLEQ